MALSGRASLAAVLALVGVPVATAAASGSKSSTGATPFYGPARDWGGTHIRPMDCPAPPLPVPVGCPTNSSPPPSGPASGPTGRQIPADQILSNEMTFTEWANVHRIANIYLSPSTHSRQISRLHSYTEDDFNETYLLLRAHWNGRTEWIKLRIPGRPNGRTGWVERNALGRFHVTHDAVVVNRNALRIYFYRNGRRIWSAPVGIGAPLTPTPAGHFWIRERFAIASPASGYWPFAFGTADYSTISDWPKGGVVGIHGPFGAPVSAIPGRISHGCIRLHTWDDAWLGRHLAIGTPLRVV